MEGWAIINTSVVVVVTLTDRPKSVRNLCEIEVFGGGFFVLSRCFLKFSVGVGTFVIGLSQIFSFFSSFRNVHFTYIQLNVRDIKPLRWTIKWEKFCIIMKNISCHCQIHDMPYFTNSLRHMTSLRAEYQYSAQITDVDLPPFLR